MLGINNDRASLGGCCHPADRFSYISLEVPSLNKFFYQELKALVVVGFVAMVPVIIAP